MDFRIWFLTFFKNMWALHWMGPNAINYMAMKGHKIRGRKKQKNEGHMKKPELLEFCQSGSSDRGQSSGTQMTWHITTPLPRWCYPGETTIFSWAVDQKFLKYARGFKKKIKFFFFKFEKQRWKICTKF